MPFDYPQSEIEDPIAPKADIQSIQIYNHGTGAMNAEFRVNTMFGVVKEELDPALPSELDVHLFESYGSPHNVLQARFGQFIAALQDAVDSNSYPALTQERVDTFKSNAVNYFLSGIPLSKEALDLATICPDEMQLKGIVLHWPEKKIRK